MTTLSLPPERLMGQGTRASARGEAVPARQSHGFVRDAGSFTMRLGCLTAEGQPVQQWEWESMWGEERKIQLS
jgi:hypothetical protein